MLAHLRVQNLGVLGDVSIDPGPGLTVITGETGAGKTLLVGGLRLILGERPDPGAVGPLSDKAQADGLFVTDEDEEVGVTRIVPRDGRSRCLLDGATVSTSAASEVVGRLVEIVAQHDQLGLRRPSQVLSMVDACLDEGGTGALDAYRAAWIALQEMEGRQRALGGDPRAMVRELDLLRHQSSEIEGARLRDREDEELELEAARLRNLEEIGEHLSESARLTRRLADDGGEIVSRLRKVSSLDPSASQVAEGAEGVAAGIADLTAQIRGAIDDLDVDPRRHEEVEKRLTLMGELKRKYGKTLEEVLAYGAKASQRAAELASVAEDADRLEAELALATEGVSRAAEALHQARRLAATRLASGVEEHLGSLGMGGAVLEVRLEAGEPAPDGADRAELWFASDHRLDPGPLSSVASGGELSRLVLAVRLATRSSGSTTLVFDEVDAGVGGATAITLGRMLGELARDTQVLSVTHLAQVAAQADTHYAIEREGPTAAIRQVTGEDRLAELARMIAGSSESAPGRRTARELIASAKSG